MSIGNRWPRPGQAAVGALDHVPVGDWPGLAARWLAAGFDSESLRQLAKLRSWETGAALVLMPEALRSIGFDPAPAGEEFRARCQAALDIVQRDLDVTGYGRYRVRARSRTPPDNPDNVPRCPVERPVLHTARVERRA